MNRNQKTITRRTRPRLMTSQEFMALVKFGLAIWAILFAVVVFVLAAWDQWDKTRGMTFWGLVKASGAISGLGFLCVMIGTPVLVWLLARKNGFDILKFALLEMEEASGVDINQDGMIGTHVMIQTKKNQWMMGQYRVKDPMALVDWANAAVSGKSLAYSRWEDRFGGRKMYQEFRDELVQRGLASETKRNQIKITKKGYEYFGRIATLQPEQMLPELPGPK